MYGSAGRHRFAGRAAAARACFGRLADELVAAVDGSGPLPALTPPAGSICRRSWKKVYAVAR